MGSAQAAGQNNNGARDTISPAAAWAPHVSGHALSAKTTVHAKVWLAPRSQSQLDALAKAVSDPSSAAYGHYLSAAAYQSQFAPTKADVAAVTSWLTSAGLRVEGTGPDNHFLAVAGAPSAIEAAFTAGVEAFTVNGQSVTGATHAVSAPASVAPHVLAVTGLSTLGHQVSPSAAGTEPDVPGTNNGHRVQLGPPAGFVNAGPCSSFYGQQKATSLPPFEGETLPYAVCGYTPSQFRDAYGLTEVGLTGKGQTLAFVDAFTSPWLEKDTNTYSTRHGQQPFRSGSSRSVAPGASIPSGSPTAAATTGTGSRRSTSRQNTPWPRMPTSSTTVRPVVTTTT